MIRARGYYRQDRENERRHHDLGEFEGSRKRTVEHVSSNDVDESADHQAEEDRRGEPAHNLFYEMERSGGLPARRRFSVTATAQACEPRRADPREPPPRRLPCRPRPRTSRFPPGRTTWWGKGGQSG